MTETGSIPQQERALHALNRLAFGPRPGDLKHVRQIGYERYIQEQLNPDSIEIPHSLIDKVAGYPTLGMSPLALFIEYWRPVMEAQREYRREGKAAAAAGGGKGRTNSGKEGIRQARIRARVVAREAVEARILRAIEGPRQLQEVMTAFWFNHFNVFAAKGLDLIWTGSFEQTAIRPHTMGKFRALLGATARHPAMLFYLDNWRNTAPGSPGARKGFDGINENYAREVMELHTLGVSGGYTQADVITLAHILTGWGLPPGRAARARMRERMTAAEGAGGFGRFRRFRRRAGDNPGGLAGINPDGFYFDASRHDFSSKVFLGHRIEGAGLSEGEHALDILASSPATAHHLSYELAQYFVADDPPPTLVERMAARYTATGGEIRAVLETMFSSGEFWERRYCRGKFKTPYDYVISSVRAAGAPVRNYRPLYGSMALLGMPLYGCQTPNGYANTREAWLNPDAMMMRVSFATALGTGHLPLEHPPFRENAAAAGAMREPKLFGKRGGNPRIGMEAIAPRRRPPAMTPPQAIALVDTLGGQFAPSTMSAVEQANPALRSAMILGSPDFMVR